MTAAAAAPTAPSLLQQGKEDIKRLTLYAAGPESTVRVLRSPSQPGSPCTPRQPAVFHDEVVQLPLYECIIRSVLLAWQDPVHSLAERFRLAETMRSACNMRVPDHQEVVHVALELNSRLVTELQQRIRILEGLQDEASWHVNPMVQAFASTEGFHAWRAREIAMLRTILSEIELLPAFSGQLEVTVERAHGLAFPKPKCGSCCCSAASNGDVPLVPYCVVTIEEDTEDGTHVVQAHRTMPAQTASPTWRQRLPVLSASSELAYLSFRVRNGPEGDLQRVAEALDAADVADELDCELDGEEGDTLLGEAAVQLHVLQEGSAHPLTLDLWREGRSRWKPAGHLRVNIKYLAERRFGCDTEAADWLSAAQIGHPSTPRRLQAAIEAHQQHRPLPTQLTKSRSELLSQLWQLQYQRSEAAQLQRANSNASSLAPMPATPSIARASSAGKGLLSQISRTAGSMMAIANRVVGCARRASNLGGPPAGAAGQEDQGAEDGDHSGDEDDGEQGGAGEDGPESIDDFQTVVALMWTLQGSDRLPRPILRRKLDDSNPLAAGRVASATECAGSGTGKAPMLRVTMDPDQATKLPDALSGKLVGGSGADGNGRIQAGGTRGALQRGAKWSEAGRRTTAGFALHVAGEWVVQDGLYEVLEVMLPHVPHRMMVDVPIMFARLYRVREEWVRLVMIKQLLGEEELPLHVPQLQAIKVLWGPVVASWRRNGLTKKETRIHQQLAFKFHSYIAAHLITIHSSFGDMDHEVIRLALDIFAMAELGAPLPNAPPLPRPITDQQPGKQYEVPTAVDAVEAIKKLLYAAVQQRLEPWLKVDSMQRGTPAAGQEAGSGEEARGFVRLSAIIQCINTTIADMDIEMGLQEAFPAEVDLPLWCSAVRYKLVIAALKASLAANSVLLSDPLVIHQLEETFLVLNTTLQEAGLAAPDAGQEPDAVEISMQMPQQQARHHIRVLAVDVLLTEILGAWVERTSRELCDRVTALVERQGFGSMDASVQNAEAVASWIKGEVEGWAKRSFIGDNSMRHETLKSTIFNGISAVVQLYASLSEAAIIQELRLDTKTHTIFPAISGAQAKVQATHPAAKPSPQPFKPLSIPLPAQPSIKAFTQLLGDKQQAAGARSVIPPACLSPRVCNILCALRVFMEQIDTVALATTALLPQRVVAPRSPRRMIGRTQSAGMSPTLLTSTSTLFRQDSINGPRASSAADLAIDRAVLQDITTALHKSASSHLALVEIQLQLRFHRLLTALTSLLSPVLLIHLAEAHVQAADAAAEADELDDPPSDPYDAPPPPDRTAGGWLWGATALSSGATDWGFGWAVQGASVRGTAGQGGRLGSTVSSNPLFNVLYDRNPLYEPGDGRRDGGGGGGGMADAHNDSQYSNSSISSSTAQVHWGDMQQVEMEAVTRTLQHPSVDACVFALLQDVLAASEQLLPPLVLPMLMALWQAMLAAAEKLLLSTVFLPMEVQLVRGVVQRVRAEVAAKCDGEQRNMVMRMSGHLMQLVHWHCRSLSSQKDKYQQLWAARDLLSNSRSIPDYLGPSTVTLQELLVLLRMRAVQQEDLQAFIAYEIRSSLKAPQQVAYSLHKDVGLIQASACRHFSSRQPGTLHLLTSHIGFTALLEDAPLELLPPTVLIRLSDIGAPSAITVDDQPGLLLTLASGAHHLWWGFDPRQRDFLMHHLSKHEAAKTLAPLQQQSTTWGGGGSRLWGGAAAVGGVTRGDARPVGRVAGGLYFRDVTLMRKGTTATAVQLVVSEWALELEKRAGQAPLLMLTLEEILGATPVKGEGANWYVVVAVRMARKKAELSLLVGAGFDAADIAAEVAAYIDSKPPKEPAGPSVAKA